jgi:hypothetical protein
MTHVSQVYQGMLGCVYVYGLLMYFNSDYTQGLRLASIDLFARNPSWV